MRLLTCIVVASCALATPVDGEDETVDDCRTSVVSTQ